MNNTKPFIKDKSAKIFIAGHRGMVGSAISRQLKKQGYQHILEAPRNELDLTNQAQVKHYFEVERPDYIFLAAAKVGGIHANNEYPANFIYENLMIESNIIHSAYSTGAKRLLFLGSSCIYPKLVAQPMPERALLTGTLEATNEPYALAKIAGIKLCESYNRQHGVDFRSVMPTNLYGPGDNFHPENSHVIPALLSRFHEAKIAETKSIEIWGTGTPKREFLYVEDMANASIYVMGLSQDDYQRETKPMCSHINIGTGQDISIRNLATTIKDVTGYQGDICFNTDMPDGAPRKLLDVTLLERLGWKAQTDLNSGLEDTYSWFLANQNNIRAR
jgi:GDP-L-fucose synthase